MNNHHPLNDKKTEVSHIRLSSSLLSLARGYHAWRKEAHPRLTLQAAMGELMYQGALAALAFRESIGQQGAVEQEKDRSENEEFATKFLGEKEAVASQY